MGFTVDAKKLLLFFITLFYILYISYKPYNGLENVHSGIKYIFALYFFVINQSLGIIHEGGHGICYLFSCPEFITTLNGTVFQWGLPFLAAIYYKKRGNLLAYYLLFFILAISMDYTAWYISTSNEGLYVPADKSFLGIEGYHDFNYMLSTLGILSYYKVLSILVKAASVILMFYSYLRLVILTFDEKESI